MTYFTGITRNVKYCGICKGERVRLNRASTSFCEDCHYDITRGSNVSRMISNPLYEQYGYQIKDWHPDYEKLRSVER